MFAQLTELYQSISVMKMFARNITFLIFLGLLAGCEKFELDDHCPENEGPMVNPQELRVNDDTDSEDEVKPGSKSLSAEDNSNLNENEIHFGVNGDDDNIDTDNNGELVNDDSDDEDESRPRTPGDDNGLGGASSPKDPSTH